MDSVQTALKEWAIVCESLGRGLQVFLPRAGGIDEDRFETTHSQFALLQTRFHEDASRLRPEIRERLTDLSEPRDGGFEVRYVAERTAVFQLADVSRLASVANLQALAAEVLRGRFEYREGPLTLIVIRVMALPKPIRVEAGSWSEGCRSWVSMPTPISTVDARPVLDDAAFENAVETLEKALSH